MTIHGLGTKEAELNAAILNYAARCVLDGDLDVLFKMGFTAEDLQSLSDFRISDLHAVSGARDHPLNITLDRKSWEWLLDLTRRRRTRGDLKRELLLLDAPADMMMSFFGMSAKQYTHDRMLAGLEVSKGRPSCRPISPEDEGRLWQLWLLLANPVSPSKLRSEDLWLLIGRELSTGLRAAWTQIQRWARESYALERFSAGRAGLRGEQIAAQEDALRRKHRVQPTAISTLCSSLYSPTLNESAAPAPGIGAISARGRSGVGGSSANEFAARP